MGRVLQSDTIEVRYSESTLDDSQSSNTWDLGSEDGTDVVDETLLSVDDFVDAEIDANEETENNAMVESIDENVDDGPQGGVSLVLDCQGTLEECEQQTENETNDTGNSESKSTWYWYVIGVVGLIIIIATCHYCSQKGGDSDEHHGVVEEHHVTTTVGHNVEMRDSYTHDIHH